MMTDQEIAFFGQQDGERVLYDVQTHPWAKWIELIKILLAGVLTIFLFGIVGFALQTYAGVIWLVGVILGIVIIAAGWYITLQMGKRNKAYITDRRVVRFTATSLWSSTTRTLSWDEIVKVKTSSTSFWLRRMNVGSVIASSRTPEDDITLNGVAYYQDLGNYMDKVMFTYKREPERLPELRPFIPKPRGQRY